ncbi:MAG TPA: adenylate/guanylate cyclase domain-containing protein [Acidimicrobiales bacterium]|nr:adenylate/guanylate cyclase domain-containing protein [Acidimicrobiales bacterium]
MGTEPPSGTVTFLFTDIEGSTSLWETAPDAMRAALERHDSILRSAIGGHGGYIFSTGGDGFAAAFARAGEAVTTAVEAQQGLMAETWPELARLRVRMGLHSGEASERDGDYFGTTVNRAARLMATAHGGQVVCSRSTTDLAAGVVAFHSLGEHRLRDLAAAEQVFQVGDDVFPPLRSVDAVPTNLPTTRTELLGRSEEVATLAALTAKERLVTLTGVGGVGKTRLALGVAASVAPDYADGCWLIDLAPVSDGSEVPVVTAAAIRAPVTAAAAIVTYLSDRRMLLLLDNCEHVIGDVADLVDGVLESANEIHVIATSREPLGLDGEVVRRVESLGVSAEEATIEEARAAPAVRLFVERAEAVADRFVFDDTTVGPVTEICRRLDGIPLAIELAAARLRSMSAEEISRRLDERFRLLGGGSRRAQERQRTLSATVSWSHDLLSVDDQTVFRRLAVFPASFDLSATEEVASTEDDRFDVVDCLLSLVDRSLVQFDPEKGRYRLLETLRQYAADKLADAGETETFRRRHAQFFLALVLRRGPELLDDCYVEAHAALVAELDNLRATATWLIDHDRWADLAMFCRTSIVLAIQSAPVEGADWRMQIIEHRSELQDNEVVTALGELAYLAVQSFGAFDDAIRWANQSEVVADECGIDHSPWALISLGSVAIMTGRYADALDAGERAIELADRTDEWATQVIARLFVSGALASLDRPEESDRAISEALRRAKSSGSPMNIGAAAITASSNSLNRLERPDFITSKQIIDEGRDAFAAPGANEMWMCLMFGFTLLGLGESDAVGYLTRALQLADRLNAQHVAERSLRLLALAFAQAGHAKEAAILIGYAEIHLSRYRMADPVNTWMEDQLDRAGLTSERLEGVPAKRGEILNLVATTERSIARDSPGLLD